MPTYDFVCNNCQNRFSLRLTIEAKEQASCPACASPDLKQLFTGFLYTKAGGNSGGCSRSNCDGCSGC